MESRTMAVAFNWPSLPRKTIRMAAMVNKGQCQDQDGSLELPEKFHFNRCSRWMDGLRRRKHFKIIIQEESACHEQKADPLTGHKRRPTDGKTEIMRDPAPQGEHQNVKQKQEEEFALKNAVEEGNIVFHKRIRSGLR